MKNCIACNELLEDDAKFCSECRAEQPEKSVANFSEFIEKLAKSDEMLERLYRNECDRVKTEISKLKQQAELLPFREGNNADSPEKKGAALLMSERYEKLLYITFEIGHETWRRNLSFNTFLSNQFTGELYRPHSVDVTTEPGWPPVKKFYENLGFTDLESEIMEDAKYRGGTVEKKILNSIEKSFVSISETISNISGTLVNDACYKIFSECNEYLSGFSVLVDDLYLTKQMPKIQNYYIGDTDEKPWVIKKESNSLFMGVLGLGSYVSPEKKREMIKNVLDASQGYINSLIDNAEQHCVETLTIIKKFYEEQLQIVLAPVSEKIYGNR